MQPHSNIMTTFKYESDCDLPTDTAELVRRWSRRRSYPITYRCGSRAVTIDIAAPDTGEHNRAVNSLARIIDRAIARAEWASRK